MIEEISLRTEEETATTAETIEDVRRRIGEVNLSKRLEQLRAQQAPPEVIFAGMAITVAPAGPVDVSQEELIALQTIWWTQKMTLTPFSKNTTFVIVVDQGGLPLTVTQHVEHGTLEDGRENLVRWALMRKHSYETLAHLLQVTFKIYQSDTPCEMKASHWNWQHISHLERVEKARRRAAEAEKVTLKNNKPAAMYASKLSLP